MLRRRIESVLAGRHSPAPRVDVDERIALAARVRGARRSMFPDPRELGVALGLMVCAVEKDVGEALTDGACLWYLWDADARVRGLRVYCALALAVFLRARVVHVDADVALLTVDLAVPPELRAADPEAIALCQRHVPVWLVELAIGQLPALQVRA